jgi:L-ascorbate metabolism protein UlaG (beta-lactamase superfamily)
LNKYVKATVLALGICAIIMAGLLMKRRSFIQFITMFSGMLISPKTFAKRPTMKIHFIRHATFILEIGGVKFLVDPMLSPKDAMDPVKVSRNDTRIPMVELPLSKEALQKELASIDAVIVTHTHRDHWDPAAREILNKKLPILIPPTDEEVIRGQGFENIISIHKRYNFKGLMIFRTEGQHGTGDIGAKMGHVSGFVIVYKNETIYIAGDTIWCEDVEHALTTHNPTITILNAGAAQFDTGHPITMTAEDVIKVLETSPSTKVIAVHMDTVNHCGLSRKDLEKVLTDRKLITRTIIPKDGEVIKL